MEALEIALDSYSKSREIFSDSQIMGYGLKTFTAKKCPSIILNDQNKDV